MRTMILICLMTVASACATATPVHDGFQVAKEQCIYRTTYPKNMRDSQKLAYMRNVAVPACLKANGF